MLLAPTHAQTEDDFTLDAEDPESRFTFSWNLTDRPHQMPRGGTTRGIPVTLALVPTPEWMSLTDPEKSTFERDRAAIIAMAGEYRASFEFLETITFQLGLKVQQPYQSWGTEYIFVVRDDDTFISLQHILVMQMQDDQGQPAPPIIIKHWRQDWRFEDQSMNVYFGNGRWGNRLIDPKTAKGAWTQAVFQVDDSPRYESFGRWVHADGISTWKSGETWRPLPRRESSVRDDYDVLVGTNRHSITPNGWVQEEENLKVKLSDERQWRANSDLASHKVLAKEIGLNRYERIEGFDFSPAQIYWKNTSEFWDSVKTQWQEILSTRKSYSIPSADRHNLLMAFMMRADRLVSPSESEMDTINLWVEDTIKTHVKFD